MRRSTLIVLLTILGILIVVGFFITDPDLSEQLLVDLGLSEPVQEGYVLSGLVEAQVTFISGENGGKVIDIFVSEGSRTESGDVLAVLDSTLLEPELEASEARLEFAHAQLEMIEGGPRTVDIAVAEAAVGQAKALRDGALLALEDARNSNPVSLRDEQVAVAQALLNQADASLTIVEAARDALLAGASQANIDSATAAIVIAESEIAGLEAVIEKQKLVAPKDAVVLDVFLLSGEFALPGQAVLSMADIREVDVTVYVPEFDLNWVNLGEIVDVKFDAFPDRRYAGVVIHISDRAEFTPRNIQTPEERVILVYPVTVRIANPAGDLKPGLTVDVIFGGES
jgi:HlyD family secretion protein